MGRGNAAGREDEREDDKDEERMANQSKSDECKATSSVAHTCLIQVVKAGAQSRVPVPTPAG
ncbi:hypothetical protein ASF16_04300 [Acidovorax sp. Leaf78]|nr:hypothetical protein ASF16_04300 [Acidovorax sp. Leaf78]